jgi:hypothetical protein
MIAFERTGAHNEPMSAEIEQSKKFDNGARFVKAALQVNPYQYLLKNSKSTSGLDESGY